MSEQKQILGDYLTGLAKGDPKVLEDMAGFDGWQDLAKQELQRRRMAIINIISDDTLAAIASGEVNPAEVARERMPG
ncbi:MAG: hypothetical protein OEX12_15995 [Gammaproteobacteria bacterium]|nr:hypothetical protein [Gammaproteobacteria bacterium]